MMEVYFLNNEGEIKLIHLAKDSQDAQTAMNNYLEFNNYQKPRYFRYWLEDEYTKCDFGSWSEFFLIKGDFINGL